MAPGWQRPNNNGPAPAGPQPWSSPDYGYKFVTSKNKKTGRESTKKVYVGQTQYLNEDLGNAQLQGVIDLLKPDMSSGAGGAAAYGVNLPGGNTSLSANQTMYLFKNADKAVRAQIQDMMYRAGGLYAKNYVPNHGGPLTKQDIDAFRKFIIGVASNPAQGPVGDLLNEAATAGDNIGVHAPKSKATYNPLIETITDPQDIKNTANAVGKELHGTYLTADQLKVFTAAYQTMEKAYQEQIYTANGGDMNTGIVDPANATAAVITKPPSPDSSAFKESEAASIRNNNPEQFMANTFTDRLDEVLAKFRSNKGSTQGGVPL